MLTGKLYVDGYSQVVGADDGSREQSVRYKWLTTDTRQYDLVKVQGEQLNTCSFTQSTLFASQIQWGQFGTMHRSQYSTLPVPRARGKAPVTGVGTRQQVVKKYD